MSYGTPPPTDPPEDSGQNPQDPTANPGNYGTPSPPAPQYGEAPPAPQYGQAAPPPAPQYGQQPQQYGQTPGYAQVPASTNSKARLSLILSIVGLVICGILGPVAIILSRQATTEIVASNGTQSGQGLAKAGFIIGIIVTVLWAIGLIVRLSGAGN